MATKQLIKSTSISANFSKTMTCQPICFHTGRIACHTNIAVRKISTQKECSHKTLFVTKL